MRLASIILLLSVLLTGCLQPATEDRSDDQDLDPDLTSPLEVANDAEDCSLAVAVVQVSMDQARSVLPDHYEPADAQRLLETPAPTGKAAVLLTAYSCGRSGLDPTGLDGAEVNIVIAPPSVAGDREPADLDYYLLALHTDNERFVTLLQSVNGTVVEGAVDLEMTQLPTSTTTATADVHQADVTAYSLDVTSNVPSALSGLSRFWHETSNGTAWFDYRVDADIVVGSASCSIDADSFAGRATRMTACPRDTVGIVVPSFSWSSTFWFEPGLKAEGTT